MFPIHSKSIASSICLHIGKLQHRDATINCVHRRRPMLHYETPNNPMSCQINCTQYNTQLLLRYTCLRTIARWRGLCPSQPTAAVVLLLSSLISPHLLSHVSSLHNPSCCCRPLLPPCYPVCCVSNPIHHNSLSSQQPTTAITNYEHKYWPPTAVCERCILHSSGWFKCPIFLLAGRCIDLLHRNLWSWPSLLIHVLELIPIHAQVFTFWPLIL